jgi:hypothetical protein
VENKTGDPPWTDSQDQSLVSFHLDKERPHWPSSRVPGCFVCMVGPGSATREGRMETQGQATA